MEEENKAYRDNIDYLPGKLVSGHYLDKISFDGKEFKVYKKEEKYLVLLYKNSGDGIAVYLPLPLRFDEKWLLEFRGINLNVGSIIAYYTTT